MADFIVATVASHFRSPISHFSATDPGLTTGNKRRELALLFIH